MLWNSFGHALIELITQKTVVVTGSGQQDEARRSQRIHRNHHIARSMGKSVHFYDPESGRAEITPDAI